MERVLISDKLDPACAEYLTEHGFVADQQVGLSPDALKAAAAGAVGWIVRSGTTITPELIEAASSLRVIGRAGVGVDNINLQSATRRGVVVINAPEGNTISTAEHACALILALARRVSAAHQSMREGAWDRKQFVGTELFGKTLGIIGVGRVGRGVAERMRAFGMNVIGFDPVVSPDVAKDSGVELVTLEDVVERSDVITLHVPLTKTTAGLFDAQRLAACKPGVLLVNCARGGLIDESALLDALKSGHVGGAALDVYAQEPPGDGLADLVAHPNVVCTPHIAASTAEAQQKVAVQVTEQVVRGLRGEPVATPVNASAIRLSSRPEVRPFVALAEMLGRLVTRLNAPQPIRRVIVEGAGDIPRAAREVLAVGALAGVLGELLDDRVNLVNAEALAQEAGLPVNTEWASAASNYQHYIDVVLDTPEGTRSIRGTLFGGEDARIVALDGYELELRPAGTMLFYKNVDRPGMLAAVGAIVAAADVNIGAMALGRKDRGSAALTVMHLDDKLDAHQLARIGELEGVEDVRLVDVESAQKTQN